jgi:hypothetical protein
MLTAATHGDGTLYDAAADLLVWLMGESRIRKLIGIDLKDQRTGALGLRSTVRLSGIDR